MADEIKVNIQLTCENSYLKETFYPGQINITQAAVGAHCPVVSVSTSEENLVTGDISTLGYVVGRNLDGTNYVIIGPSTGGALYPFMRVKAGEPFALRLEPGITWRWKGVGGTVKVQLKIFEN